MFCTFCKKCNKKNITLCDKRKKKIIFKTLLGILFECTPDKEVDRAIKKETKRRLE
jgi:hypothetical protein